MSCVRPIRSNAPNAGSWRCSPRHAPTILALTRQGVPVLRTTHTDENLSAKGGYLLIDPKGKRDVTLIGTGSELSLAVEAAKALAGEGIAAAVVSMPCFELFEAQAESYRNAVLGSAPRVAVEAARRVRLGEMAGP